jgi:hypothetical protein
MYVEWIGTSSRSIEVHEKPSTAKLRWMVKTLICGFLHFSLVFAANSRSIPILCRCSTESWPARIVVSVHRYIEEEGKPSFDLCQPRQPVSPVNYDIYVHESANTDSFSNPDLNARPITHLYPQSHHPSPPRLFTTSVAMASRRLALNLQQSLRSRKALSALRHPLQRGLATPVSYGSKTESTTLSNGFTVRWRWLNWTGMC